MNYRIYCQAFFFCLFAHSLASGSSSREENSMEGLSCAPSCSSLRRVRRFYGAVCSCSPSCLIYGDCCGDAFYNNTGESRPELGCVTVNGLGPISVVNNCPSTSLAESEVCTKDLGTKVPVTSRNTGVSYSSYDCALCNSDNSDLVHWPVELRCCLKDEDTPDTIVPRKHVQYDVKNDDIISEFQNGSRLSCSCKFYTQDSGLTFATSLELRKCVRQEISHCPSYWKDESTRELCSSYMDPVQSGQNVYRNAHCAICNYENYQELKCPTPQPIKATLLSSKDAVDFDVRSFLTSRGAPRQQWQCGKGTVLHPRINKCVKFHNFRRIGD